MAVLMCLKDAFVFMMLFGNLFSFTDGQLEAFKDLQEVDKEISKSFALLLDDVKQQTSGVSEEMQKKVLDNLALEGSILEGSVTSPVFKPIKTTDGLNRELRTGFTYNIMEVPEKSRHLVEDIGGKEGFVKVRADMDALSLGFLPLKVDPKEYEEIVQQVVTDGYLKPYRLKEKVLQIVEKKLEQLAGYDGTAELFLAVALNATLDSIKLSRPENKLSELPTSSYIDVMVENKLKLKASWDVGTTIKLNWWPRVAREWINRKREWPSKDTITSLTSSSYIATKPSDELTQDKDSLELRYSFGHVERALVAERSPQQALMYLIFKSMLYRWNKPIHSDRIHSLIAKNVMLWTCEEYPPEHSIWSDTSAISALSVLFDKLLEALESKTLPNYFIPKINIFENLDDATRDREIEQIKRMLTNVNEYVPDNVKVITEACREILNIVQSTHAVLKDIANQNYDIFIQRPELIPKAIQIFGFGFMSMGGKDQKEKIDKKIGDVKDTITDKWDEYTKDLNIDDVVDTVKKVANMDMDEIEKKAKEWMQKWEL